jgi:glycosyltransferase involved in cell wall biosynthesis
MNLMKKVSIIIPCRNEEKYIKKCLDSVLSTSYSKDNLEIIVVDGMSTDRTPDIVKQYISEFHFIHLLENKRKVVPVAMNIGIGRATGDIVIRLDAHAVYPRDYIATLVTWKSKLGAANIGTVMQTSVLNKNPKSIAIQKILSHKLGVGNGLFRTGVDKPVEVDTVPFGCFDKDILIKVGGYDERLLRNQDIELNKRIKKIKGKIFLIPYSMCTYFARETWSALFRNNYKNGLWNIKTVYLTKLFSSLSLRHFIPLLFILSLTIPLILTPLFPHFCFLSFFVIIIYLIALSFSIVNMKRNDTTFYHLLITFIILHISYGLGSLVGLFNLGSLFKNEVRRKI